MNQVSNNKEPRIWLRWVLVLCVLGLIAAGAAGAYSMAQKVGDKKAKQALEESNELRFAGQHVQAIQKLEEYLARFPENVSVWDHYAQYVLNVPLPNNQHIKKAMGAHQRILALEPNRQESVVALLDIYDMAGMSTEAIKQADVILADHQGNAKALKVKSKHLAEIGEYDQAYKTLEILHQLDPLDLGANWQRLSLMHDQGQRSSQLLDWIDGISKNHQDDSSIVLLRAYALAMGSIQDRENAISLLDTLIFDGIYSEVFFQKAIYTNDLLGRFDRSLEICRQAAIEYEFKSFRKELVSRLWQNQNPKEIVDLFVKNDQQNQTRWEFEGVESTLHLVAWSYLALQQIDEYHQFVTKRRDQTRSRYELIWYELLDHVAEEVEIALDHSQEQVSELAKNNTPERIQKRKESMRRLIDEGLSLWRSDPYLHFWAGKIDAADRRFQMAIDHWEKTIVQRRAWIPPYHLLIEAKLQAQQNALAYQMSLGLLQRDQSLQTVLIYLRAAQANLDDLPSEHFVQVAEIVEQVQEKLSMASLAALQVEILIRQDDREEALSVIQYWLDRDELLAENVMAGLARLDQKYRLGVFDQIRELSLDAYGMTPSIAVIEAIDQAVKNGAEAGLATFNQLRPESLSADEKINWDLTRVRLIERLSPMDAGEEWFKLVQTYSQNSTLLGIVSEKSFLWEDLDKAKYVVDQLKLAVGEAGYEYKVAAVRLKFTELDSLPENQQERVLAEVVAELARITRDYPYLLTPQLLMGQAQEQLGTAAVAAQYYGRAYAIAPDRLGILLAQASALVRAGQVTVAKSLMQDQEHRYVGKPTELLAIAGWWRQHQDIANVSRLVTQASNLVPENRRLQLEQARLQLLEGEVEQVLAWIKEAIDEPDTETLLFAARLYGELNDVKGLSATLTAIERLPDVVTIAERDWLQAECLWRMKDFDSAQKSFASALQNVAIVNQVAEGWLLACLSGDDSKRLQDAFSQLSEQSGLKQPVLDFVAQDQVFVSGFSTDTRGVLIEALRGRLPVEACLQVVSQITSLRERSATWLEALPTFTALADQYPESPSLTGFKIMALLRTNQYQKALGEIELAKQEFPRELSIRLFDLLANNAAQNWQEVIRIGKQLGNEGGPVGRVGAVTAARAAMKLADGETARSLLTLIKPENEIELGDDLELSILWVAAGYVAGKAYQADVPHIEKIFSDAQSRSVLLQTLLEANAEKSVVSEMIAVQWLDFLLSLVPSEDRVSRIQLGMFARVHWDRYKTQVFADRAESIWSSVLDEFEDQAGVALMLGQLKEVQAELESASAYYQQVVDLDPENLVAFNNYAMVSSALGHHDRAIALAKKAEGLSPDADFVLDTVALVSMAANELDLAAQAIEKAIKLSPNKPEWRLTACAVYIAALKYELAQKQIDDLKALNVKGVLSASDRRKMRDLEKQIEMAQVPN